MEYKVEYLAIFDADTPICGSLESFVHLLSTVDGITASPTGLERNSVRFRCEIQRGETGSSTPPERFYHLRIFCPSDQQLDDFEALLRLVRTVLQTASARRTIEVLWDDVAFQRGANAYPELCRVENMMRKLITRFMLQSAGVRWVKDTVPREVTETIKSKRADRETGFLYELDFIQLAGFLFREYTSPLVPTLADQVRDAASPDKLSLDELRKALPRSNWDRYFYSAVKCDAAYLKVRWERLYELRNSVAHNRGLSRDEHQKVQALVGELVPLLQRALDGLESVVVPEDEREAVAEDAASTRNELVGEFLKSWTLLHKAVVSLLDVLPLSIDDQRKVLQSRFNMTVLGALLQKAGAPFERTDFDQLRALTAFRNMLVHDPDPAMPDGKIADRIVVVRQLQRTAERVALEKRREKNA